MFNSYKDVMAVNQYIQGHKKEFNNEIGFKIKFLKNQKKISTESFAQKTFMSPSYIIQMENGRYGLTLNKFVLVCNALEINPNSFLEEFLYGGKTNEDILYYEIQNGKNISKNIIDYFKIKKTGLEY